MKTVIVRVFEAAPGSGQVRLHGVVEEVRTGMSVPFHGAGQLLRAIEEATGAGEPAAEKVFVPPSDPTPTGIRHDADEPRWESSDGHDI